MFRSFASVSLAGLALAATAGAQTQDTIFFDAANSETVMSENRTVFYRLRITQGSMRIEAERGVTQADTDFSQSRWQFEGNVEIDINNAEIRAGTADLQFDNYELVRAEVEGDLASFSDTNVETGELTEGEAKRFVYNLSDQVVRFEGNAQIRDALNTVTGGLLKYDLANQSIVFEGNEQSGERVRITIQPPPEASDEAVIEQTRERALEEAEDVVDEALKDFEGEDL
ncbi:MAG: LptA/OstA family protein [Pseudomonadota bacterium]